MSSSSTTSSSQPCHDPRRARPLLFLIVFPSKTGQEYQCFVNFAPRTKRQPTGPRISLAVQLLLPQKLPRMTVDLGLDLADLHLLQVELHFLAILWEKNRRQQKRKRVLTFKTIYPRNAVLFPSLGALIGSNSLNFSASVAGTTFCAWLRTLTSIVMVLCAVGGSRARKLRAVLPDLGLKGEKAVVTEVRYLVSIFWGENRCWFGLLWLLLFLLLLSLSLPLLVMFEREWFAEMVWARFGSLRCGSLSLPWDSSLLFRHEYLHYKLLLQDWIPE